MKQGCVCVLSFLNPEEEDHLNSLTQEVPWKMYCLFTNIILGMIGVAVRVLEPILWEFEATPDGIIFRPVGGSEPSIHLKKCNNM